MWDRFVAGPSALFGVAVENVEPSHSWSDAVAGFSGAASLSLWLFAQLPQVLKIYEDKSVEGLSGTFLACWFAGDALNFASCIANEALLFQLLLAGYYCLVDSVLVAQYYYYSYIYTPPRRLLMSPKTSLRDNLETYAPQSLPLVFAPASGPLRSLLSASFVASFSKVHAMPMDTPVVDNSLLHRLFVHLSHMNAGQWMAWTCTGLYLFSRVPQLVTNARLKSTKGLSMRLVTFALLGNLFYALSLGFNRDSLAGGDQAVRFWSAQLPYFVGAAGTVTFDLFLLAQYWAYSGLVELGKEDQEGGQKQLAMGSPPTPIAFPADMAPRHIRKLSQLSPLSPMDFLYHPLYGSTGKSPPMVQRHPVLAAPGMSPSSPELFHTDL